MPTVVELLASPERVVEIPVEEIPGLLVPISALKTSLMLRFIASQARGRANPESDGVSLITIPEAAKRLAITRGYAYELARRGELPTVQVGKKYKRVPEKGLEELMARQTTVASGLYAEYTNSRRSNRDRDSTQANPPGSGTDPSGPRRPRGGHRQHRGTVGTG
jgi:excisionase family DNA binding protein